jgi:tripartite-type tricarboxylate transporter receptor subunit TctC
MARSLLHAVIACLTGLSVTVLSAQTWPERTVRLIVASSAGSTADSVARLIAEPLARELKRPVVVENKPGADQIIGFEYLARGAPPDGYVVGVVGIDGQALLPLTRPNLRFDPLNELQLVAGLGEVRYVLAGPVTAPYPSFKSLIEAVKGSPGKFNYGSSTPAVRFPTLLLMHELGLDMVHVPFAGGAALITGVASSTVDWAVIGEGSALTVKSRIRVYGISGNERSTTHPEAPTFAELGFPKIQGPAYALAVRNGTPRTVIDRLEAASAAALGDAELRVQAQRLLLTLRHQGAEAAQRDLNARAAQYRDTAQKVNLKID